MIPVKISWDRGDVVAGQYSYIDDTQDGFEIFVNTYREGELNISVTMTIAELRELIENLTSIANEKERFIKAKQAEYATKDCSDPNPPPQRPAKY